MTNVIPVPYQAGGKTLLAGIEFFKTLRVPDQARDDQKGAFADMH
jgi:hypothetical protein